MERFEGQSDPGCFGQWNQERQFFLNPQPLSFQVPTAGGQSAGDDHHAFNTQLCSNFQELSVGTQSSIRIGIGILIQQNQRTHRNGLDPGINKILFCRFQFGFIQQGFPDGSFENPVPRHAFKRFSETAFFPDADLMDTKFLEGEVFHQ